MQDQSQLSPSAYVIEPREAGGSFLIREGKVTLVSGEMMSLKRLHLVNVDRPCVIFPSLCIASDNSLLLLIGRTNDTHLDYSQDNSLFFPLILNMKSLPITIAKGRKKKHKFHPESSECRFDQGKTLYN